MRRGSCAYFGGSPKLECYGTDTPDIVTYVMSVDLSVELLLGILDLVAFIVLLQH